MAPCNDLKARRGGGQQPERAGFGRSARAGSIRCPRAAHMPLSQVATVSAPKRACCRFSGIRRTSVGERRSAGRPGLNPINDGNTLRLPIPDLTEERRKETRQARRLCRKAPDPRRRPSRRSCSDRREGRISEGERKRHEGECRS